MKLTALIHLPVLWLLGSAPTFAAGQVFVVDDAPGAGVDFTNLQTAIDAASDGDVLLLADGNHFNALPSTGMIVIDGKSLTLVAETLANVLISQPVVIENLGPGQAVLLRGIDMTAADSGLALTIRNNLGHVWIEDAVITTSSTLFPFLPSGDGVSVQSSSSVKLVRCTVTGASIPSDTNPGFDGLEATSSSVALYDCTLQGGSGGDGSSFFVGGHGARVSGGFLYAQGTTFAGGAGGQGSPSGLFMSCGDGAVGGDGLLLFSGAPVCETLDVTLSGGPGGPPGTGTGVCAAGASGTGLRVLSGSRTDHPGTARSFVASAPTREGETFSLTYFGDPFELVLLDFSTGQGFLWVDVFRGVFSLGFNYNTIVQGFVNAGGFLVRNVTLKETGVDGVPLYLQSVFLTQTDIRLGAPSTLVLLDAGI